MKKFITSLLALVLIISSCSCDNGNKGDTVTDTSVSATDANVQTNAESSLQNVETNAPINEIKLSSPEGYKYINYKNANRMFKYITLDNDGNVYGKRDKKNIKRYTPDGKPQKEIEVTDTIANIYYSNGYIYGYDTINSSIVKIEIENGGMETISKIPKTDEIKNMVVIGNIVYILLVPYCETIHNGLPCDIHDHSVKPNAVNYINFNEILYALNTDTKVLTDLKVANPIAIYGSSNDNLYVYTCKDAKYELQILNKETAETTPAATLTDAEYLFSFTFENDILIYGNARTEIFRVDTKNKKTVREEGFQLITSGGNMRFFNGNVVYIAINVNDSDRNDDEFYAKTSLSSIYIGHVDEKTDIKQLNVYGRPDDLRTSAIERATGFKLKFVQDMRGDDMNDDVVSVKILSKDEDIDFFVLDRTTTSSLRLIAKNVYTPLNESKIITDYLDSCFDYVKTAYTTENGDIIGVPITISGESIWYNPIYFEQFGITPDDVASMDGFLKTIKDLDAKKGSLGVYGHGCSLGLSFERQYDAFHNDFKNGIINYNTDTYKSIYENIWKGWIRYGSANANIKYLKTSFADIPSGVSPTLDNNPGYKVNQVIMKYEYIPNHINLAPVPFDGWRVLHEPRISEKVNKNIVNSSYILINPYSKHKEEALTVLEYIVDNLKDVTAVYPIIQKDINTYNGIYDITAPAFKDVYAIYENGMIDQGYYGSSSSPEIDDYQSGKLTIEEAIAEKQRMVEMALFE